MNPLDAIDRVAMKLHAASVGNPLTNHAELAEDLLKARDEIKASLRNIRREAERW